MNDTPRWKHKCPGCKRKIFHEYVYCNICRTRDTRLKNFRLTTGISSYRKGRWNGMLPGMRMTRDHMYAMVRDFVLCVECGHKVKVDNLRHRCYFLTDRSVRTKDKMRCRVCKGKKPKHSFPLFRRRGKQLRSMICTDCLHSSEMIIPTKRKQVALSK